MRRFATAAALYLGVLALAAVAVTASSHDGNPIAPGQPNGPDDVELVAALERFDDCDALLRYFKDEALERVGPYGLGGPSTHYGSGVPVLEGVTEEMAAPAPMAGDQAAGATAGDGDRAAPAHSGTNVQEAGVDEPDTVKTDGRILVTLAQERLHIFAVSPTGLRRLGNMRVPNAWGNEILLDGDRVLILGHAQGGVVPMPEPMPMEGAGSSMPVPQTPVSKFRLVDISDPAEPEVVSTLKLDGDYLSARLVDGVARVVVRSQPAALPFVTPKAGGLRAQRKAEKENRRVIRTSTIDQWLPYSVLVDVQSEVQTEQTLLDCDAVHHPEKFSGFGIVSVLSVDLAQRLRAEGSAGVVGSAETVYSSTENLYFALNRWQEPGAPVETDTDTAVVAPDTSTTTELHQFDISDADAARYVASGVVSGRLLNQWALSEHDGHLRVATTLDDFTGASRSESAVTVLRADDGRLRRVGRVGGLGKTEQIYSVRYEGDVGYVVTFRQTDPLYTLDLSDPENPKTVGELKIPGYSAYLHPVAGGRLLGIGQDANRQGQIKGAQISLFDVADLKTPARLDQLDLGSGSSAVEYDHRAFLYWPATSTAVVPLQTWRRQAFSGVVVLRVGEDSLRRAGRISHAGDAARKGPYCCGGGPMISRSLVIGDALVTVSDAGVMLNGLQDLKRRDWVRF